MSYLAPHFDPDVFVSYSHGDPIGGRAPLRDWTRDLIVRLEDGLHSLETEFDDLDLWMDPEIDPTAYLTDGTQEEGQRLRRADDRHVQALPEVELVQGRTRMVQRAGPRTGRRRADGCSSSARRRPTTSLWPEFLRDARGHAMPGFSFYDPEDGYPLGFQLQGAQRRLLQGIGRACSIWLIRRLRELRERAASRGAGRTRGRRTLRRRRSRRVRGSFIFTRLPTAKPRAPRSSTALKKRRHRAGGAGRRRGEGPRGLAARGQATRMEVAKRCEALALLRVDDEDRFVDDLLDIGVNERKRHVEAARGAPMPCAVLDKTGESLPIDCRAHSASSVSTSTGPTGTANSASWLDAARASPAGAAP